mmetsp:Transcript_14138/g.26585  ORF Transcript_14138/g.26585 Transcript_14138/m.26585 type:complete len:121 (-) Transcript_14138:1668-2030(-)
MNCFSIIERFIKNTCFSASTVPPSDELEPKKSPGLPLPMSIGKEREPAELLPLPQKNRRQVKEDAEELELLKELEPTYVAPKRVGPAVSASQSSVKSSTRFDLDDHEESSWTGDDFELPV